MKVSILLLLCFPIICTAQTSKSHLKCIRTNSFTKYYGQRRVTLKKPMCACWDSTSKKFGLQAKGELPVLFTIEGFEDKIQDGQTKISFSAQYGANVGRGDCDVQIIDSKDSKTFLINFSLKHYGYILQSKSYSKDTAFKVNIPLDANTFIDY